MHCADSSLLQYLVVIASTEEDATAGGMPLNEPHPSAVTVQLQHRLCHIAPQTTLRHLPYSHLARSQTHKSNTNECGVHSNVFNVFFINHYYELQNTISMRLLWSKIPHAINVVHCIRIRVDYSYGQRLYVEPEEIILQQVKVL